MADANVILTGDERQFLQSLARAEEGERSLEKQIDAVGRAGQEAGNKTGDSMEQAGRRGLSEFDKMLRELRKSGPEGRKQAAAIEKHLQETGKQGRKSVGTIIDRIAEIDPEAAEAAKEMARHMAEQSQVVEARLVKMAGPFDHFKAKAKEAFGADSLKAVKGYTAALGAIGAVLAVNTKGFEKLKEKQAEALDSLKAQEDPEKRLAQIATSSKDLEAMLAQADQLSLQTGLSREETRSLIFSGRSEGFADDVNQLARFGAVVDTQAQGQLAGSLGRLFKPEGLNVEQRLSAVLAAADKSAFDFETVGESVKKSAAPARASGADLAETLAANATLANLIGESAGDRLKTFAAKASTDDTLKGQGIIGSVQTLQGMTEEDRRKFLGESIELNEAFNLLSSNLDEVQTITAAVRSDIEASAKGQGVLGKRASIVEGSERFQNRRDLARAEMAKQIAAENRYSDSGAEIEVAQAMLDARMDELGVGLANQYLATDARITDIPYVGDFLTGIGLVPDVSASEALQYGGQAVGIDPSFTSDAFGAAVAGISKSNVPWYAKPFVSQQMATTLAAQQIAETNRLNSPEMLKQPVKPMLLPPAEPSVVPMQRPTLQVEELGTAGADRGMVLNSMRGGGDTTVADALKRSNELQAQMVETQTRMVQAIEQTANNTKPRSQPPNYSLGLQAGADAAAMP